MKKIFLINILLLSLLTGFSHSAYAVKAYPGLIQVIQPDGSVITIQKHGDEFLNWTTSGGRLVKQGADGFYYLAEFSAGGAVRATSKRVQAGPSLQGVSRVIPPVDAVEKVRNKRKEFSQIFAGRSSFSKLAPDALRVKGSTQSISSGNKRFLVILVQFSDLAFVSATPGNDFDNLLNQDGYAINNGTGSAWNYFNDNSSDLFDPQFDVVGPVALSGTVAYYGENDEEGDDVRPQEMLIEAVTLADSNYGVDFTQYDNDQDGYVDNVFIYYAGYNEAEGGPDNTIWPHSWGAYTTVDGLSTGSYACSSELRGSSGTTMAGIGTFCHEFGHVIGLPDFYDTDYEENGQARGLGSFALMSSGNYNNNGRTPPYLTSVERDLLDWLTNTPVTISEEGTYSLDPVSENKCYVVPTTNDGEFFLYEYRQLDSWDAYLRNSGLLIYHIDKSENMVYGKTAAARWNQWDGINAFASHQCCDLVEAVYPESEVENQDQVPFPGSTNNISFTNISSPAALDWAGNPIGLYLNNIADNGTRASFTVTKISELTITGTVRDTDGNPVAGAEVTLTFEESLATNVPGQATVSPSGTLLKSAPKGTEEEISTVTTDGNGVYVIETEGREGLYNLEVSKEGYYSAYRQINAAQIGTSIVNFTLNTIPEDGVMKKHGAWEGNAVGFGSPGGTIYGAVGFSAQELAPFAGQTILSMSFLVAGTTAAEVGLFITAGTEIVFSGVLNNPLFGVMTQVNLSSFGIIIPEGADMKFGYYVTDSDDGYPLAADDGPAVSMGGYAGESVASLTDTWKNLYGIDRNIIISAKIGELDNQLFSLGYYMIPNTGRMYRAGDTFTLQLNDDPSVTGVERPKAVAWFFDDQPHNAGDVITLTQGNHTVKVVLTFENHTQTVVGDIKCGVAGDLYLD